MTSLFSDHHFAEVLKALDPEDWDNESVDELLAAADKNGDGELSVKEFLTLSANRKSRVKTTDYESLMHIL